MKRLPFLTGAVLLLLFLPGASPADTPPPEAAAAAEAGLVRFLSEIPPEELVNFGFGEGETISGATIGNPWLLYTIRPNALLAASGGTDVGELITPTGLWFFPVILDGSARCILTVDVMDGKWEAVALGRSGLAGELEKISRQWPKAKGYSPKLVAVYQATAYFFTVPERDSRNLTPLNFDGVGFGGYQPKAFPEYSGTADLGDLLGQLKEAVSDNIADFSSPPEGGRE